MKSRLVILSMLVLGMLLSTAGAGLAVSGLSGENNASIAAVRRRPRRRAAAATSWATRTPAPTFARGTTAAATRAPAAARATTTQPARQVEAGANTNSNLPFTGFAAVPVLLGGIALLSAGLVLRRRTGEQR